MTGPLDQAVYLDWWPVSILGIHSDWLAVASCWEGFQDHPWTRERRVDCEPLAMSAMAQKEEQWPADPERPHDLHFTTYLVGNADSGMFHFKFLREDL